MTVTSLYMAYLNDNLTRSEFLKCCGQRYESMHPGQKSFLPDDAFLRKAEEIVAKQLFQNHPASFERLKHLAKNYVDQMNGFSNGDEISQIDSLVLANVRFVSQFIKEVKLTCQHTGVGVQLNQPKMMEVYYFTIVDCLCNNIAHFSKAQEMFEQSDSSLFDFIPYSVVLKLLEYPLTDLPELLAPSEEELEALRKRFSQLSPSDQKALFLVHFEKDKVLSEGAQKVYLQIYNLVYSMREKQKPVFAAMSKTLFAWVNSDLLLAQSLKSHPMLKEVSLPVEENRVLAFLQSLSEEEYADIQRIFSLPSQVQVCQEGIAMSNHMYRLQSIITMAYALANSA